MGTTESMENSGETEIAATVVEEDDGTEAEGEQGGDGQEGGSGPDPHAETPAPSFLALLDLSIDALAERIDDLDPDQLEALREAEAKGKTRKGALAAIDAAIEARAGGVPVSPVTVLAVADDSAAAEPGERAITLVFSDGDVQLDTIEPLGIERSSLQRSGNRFVLAEKIALGGSLDPVAITHAWLLADGEPWRRCEIPGGIGAGGGRLVEFPAGHLIF